MDGNKDDALKCLKIGREAMESGDKARAIRFLNKARRLDPDLPVDDLLSSLQKESDNQGGGKESNPSDQPSLRNRGSSAPGLSPPSSVAYTEEQITIVRQIRRKKDFYEILGLEKSCSVEDVRKAYRKLSLKVHPDKNKAPGAEEAFKSVSKAFQCLSNKESRNKYDVSGSDEPAFQRPAQRSNGFNGFHEADFNADEIFRSFFFGGMPPAATQFRSFSFGSGMGQRTGDQGSGSAGFNPRMLIQVLPVLLILLFSFLPSSGPNYSLSRSYTHNHMLTTLKGVNYFVKSARFEHEYPLDSPERARVESQVERDYFSILSQNCRAELQRQQWGFYARETPYCDMLQRFQSTTA